jgi:hypothetical protein
MDDDLETDDHGARSLESILYNTGSALASTSGVATMTEDSGSFCSQRKDGTWEKKQGRRFLVTWKVFSMTTTVPWSNPM